MYDDIKRDIDSNNQLLYSKSVNNVIFFKSFVTYAELKIFNFSILSFIQKPKMINNEIIQCTSMNRLIFKIIKNV